MPDTRFNALQAFQPVRLVMSDMDGVHTRYDDAFAERSYRASAVCAATLIDGMSFEQAYAISLASRDKTYIPYQVFIDDHGVDEDALLNVFEKVMDISYMTPETEMQAVMHSADVEHALVTKASLYWTRRILKQKALHAFYDERNTITKECYPNVSKSNSSEPYIITLDAMACLAENALMVEDTQKNLKHAKDIGMTTVWVRPRASEKKQAYTDFVFDEPIDFWRLMAQASRRKPALEN